MVGDKPAHPHDRESLRTAPKAIFPGPDSGPDAAIPWHYGDPLGEQRTAERTAVVVDRSHRFVLVLTGSERLSWLHSITTQHIAQLPSGGSAENLILDINGRVEHHFVMSDVVIDDTQTTIIDTEPDRGADLLAYLRKMVFWSDVQVEDGRERWAVLSVLGPTAAAVLTAADLPAPSTLYAAEVAGDVVVRSMPPLIPLGEPVLDERPTAAFDLLVPADGVARLRDRLIAAGAAAAGSWAWEALRVAAGRARLGVDTDERTIPHEVDWIGDIAARGAVHLDKGCYRGQETVARVHNLGSPPRHLFLVHIDGSADLRPERGADVLTAEGRRVGSLGTVIDHHELGPIALALLKRSVPVDTPLLASGTAISIDPDSAPTDWVRAGREAVSRLRGR